MWSSTRSELVLALRAARARRRQEHEMAVFIAWRTATLMRNNKRIPALSRLLRQRKRRSHQEQERIRADIAAAEAEFARLDAVAAREADDGG